MRGGRGGGFGVGPKGALLAGLTMMLAACAASGPSSAGGRQPAARAEPSQVIAAELALARTARDKGEWTAFAEHAAPEAVMFVPERVEARAWLRRQQNPAEPVRRQPHGVWSSCDGSAAVTHGVWQRPDGSAGWFSTVWEHQRRGDYRWVLDVGGPLDRPLEAPEMIASTNASCASRPEPAPAGQPDHEGRSRDRTLQWSVNDSGPTPALLVRLWNGEAMVPSDVPAGAPPRS